MTHNVMFRKSESGPPQSPRHWEAYNDFFTRFEDDDDFNGYGDQPISAIIAKICRELKIEPDWDRWSFQRWAVDEAEADLPCSPYSLAGIKARSKRDDPPEIGTEADHAELDPVGTDPSG